MSSKFTFSPRSAWASAPARLIDGALASLLLLMLGGSAQAQAPVVTSLAPTRNALAAPRTASVTATFNQPLSNTASTQQALRVFSQQAGGKKAGTAALSGNTLTFDPSTDFKAGEKVTATITAAVQSSSGQNLASGHVFQFTTATAPSSATFFNQQVNLLGSNISPVLGDVDGDGDLDVVGGSGVRLNTDGLGTFGDNQPLPTPAAYALALGDVDADGDLDLLTVNNNAAGTVSVRLNNGSGTFSGSQEVSVGSYPGSVVLGDLDGDGDLDLLTTSNATNSTGSSSVSVRLNNGSGVFSGNQEISTSSLARTALGDVDGDGDLDLVLALYNSSVASVVQVRLNDGTGAFGTGPTAPLEPAIFQLLLEDMDGDGDLDMVAAHLNVTTGIPGPIAQGRVILYRNNGLGTFASGQTIASLSNPGRISLGDLDGDNDLDLLTTYIGFRFDPPTVSINLNNGNGTLTTVSAKPYNPGIANTVLGDVDGDGDLDFLTSTVYFNQNTPTLTSVTPATAPAGTTVVIRGKDLRQTIELTLNGVSVPGFVINSDAQITFVVPTYATTGPLTVRTSVGSTSLAFTVTPPDLAATSFIPARNARAADRSTDVGVTFSKLIRNNAAGLGALKIFSQQAGGLKAGTPLISNSFLVFNPTTDFKAGETVSATLARSVEGRNDERLGAGQVFQFTTTTARSSVLFTSAPSVALVNPYGATQGDVDNDGDLDLLTVDNLSGTVTIRVRLNAGNGTFTNGQTVTFSETSYLSQTNTLLGDVDNDGDLDLVTSAGVFLNNNGVFASTPQGDTGNIALGDLDADGDLDLVGSSLAAVTIPGPITYTIRTALVRLNNGNGTFTQTQQLTVGSSDNNPPTFSLLKDMNNDGALDLIISNTSANPITTRLHLNNGFGTFDPGGQQLSISNPAVGDVDGDGDLDLVGTFDTTPTVLLNNGRGTFGPGVAVDLGAGFTPSTLGDVDGDGDLDLFVVSITQAGVRLNNGTGSFSGALNFSLNASPRTLSTADLDGDGTLDFVTVSYNSATTSGIASVYLNNHSIPTATLPAHLAEQISLYPNPAHSAVQLRLPAALARQPLQLQVLNTLGQVVVDQTLPAQPATEVALPQLPAGVYNVRLNTSQGLVVKRLLVH
ncbi:FG-GAP-like repeat-containing protein [Hymenobacter sp. GOD-10R]|uniref:FG-GAP-like repeat-containing protein n=1 Tax=Hymenobacter sp. GOD-10R TaxID=3093922 RepID=UPI002D77F204|nr:FG-GAP-like repeat-containing protein [Hymenobacter sp. GOD-10R]WRQ27031.1 FG-GAP-like repeat-containing protein [Hymenobacter sp. GOD-10R]